MEAPYVPEPYQIIKKKGSMITAANSNREVTRNESLFKKIHKSIKGNPSQYQMSPDT